MSVSAVVFLDLKGKLLLSRDYRGDIPVEKAANRFLELLGQTEDDRRAPISPILYDAGLSYIYIKHNNLYGTIKVPMIFLTRTI